MVCLTLISTTVTIHKFISTEQYKCKLCHVISQSGSLTRLPTAYSLPPSFSGNNGGKGGHCLHRGCGKVHGRAPPWQTSLRSRIRHAVCLGPRHSDGGHTINFPPFSTKSTQVATGRKTATIGVIGLKTDSTHQLPYNNGRDADPPETSNDLEDDEGYSNISVLQGIQQYILRDLYTPG